MVPTHTFGAQANGNVHSVTDALGNTTTLGYSWGRVSSITMPHDTSSIVTQINVNPDGTASWTGIGGIGTAYTYDDAMRVVSETPTGTTAIMYGYDDVSGEFVDVWRGAALARVRGDGFGRTVRATSPAGVRTDTAYDACGRVTFVSAPYTAGPGTRGTAYACGAGPGGRPHGQLRGGGDVGGRSADQREPPGAGHHPGRRSAPSRRSPSR